MNRTLLATFLVLASFTKADAVLEESRSQIEQRYGPPVGIAGYPDQRRYTYCFDPYEVEVTYSKQNVSTGEWYFVEKDGKLTAEDIEKLLRLNAAGMTWRGTDKDHWVLSISSAEPEPRATAFLIDDHSLVIHSGRTDESSAKSFFRELLQWGAWHGLPGVNANGRIKARRTISGVASLKKWSREQVLVIRGEKEVIEIPWGFDGGSRGTVREGQIYAVKVIDEDPADLDEPIAFVSDREHESRGAAVVDSLFCHLLLVKEGDRIVFDHSVCELHQKKMRERPAEIVYGMLGPESAADAECDRKFPHHRSFAAGGCVVTDDSPKKTQIYICPRCVVAYNECVSAYLQDSANQNN